MINHGSNLIVKKSDQTGLELRKSMWRLALRISSAESIVTKRVALGEGGRVGFWTVLTGLTGLTPDVVDEFDRLGGLNIPVNEVNSVHSIRCQHSQSCQHRHPVKKTTFVRRPGRLL
jgi:hypothetical protein